MYVFCVKSPFCVSGRCEFGRAEKRFGQARAYP
uniref:Uncharacterized protein n=1 Tax=Anopheles quadriannulatus TaxID=34691 RepID=A0A182XSV5_ANOQN